MGEEDCGIGGSSDVEVGQSKLARYVGIWRKYDKERDQRLYSEAGRTGKGMEHACR